MKDEVSESGVQEGAKIVAGATNISPYGISCKSDAYIPPFREVQINVVVPGGRGTPIHCSGVVVKSEKEKKGSRYDVHLYFTDMDDNSRRRLKKYLKTASASVGGDRIE